MQRRVPLFVCFGLVCHVIAGQTSPVSAGSGAPTIQVATFPAFGASSGAITGRVLNVDASKTSVATLIFIPGLGMFLKPYCAPSLLTPLNADGTFSVPIVTGGVDASATQIAVVAVPSAASVPCYGSDPSFPPSPGIPSALQNQALATALVYRPNPMAREIVFSGRSWYAKANTAQLGPGPNYFSDSASNVFVDSQDRLHLRITNSGGIWYCPELISRDSFTYGTFTFQLETAPFQDSAPVFGAFLYADGKLISHEIDMLEVGALGLGDNNNADYAIQPATPGNINRWTLLAGVPTLHTMNWQAASISFRSATAGGAALQSWGYSANPPQADVPNIQFHFNAWLFKGTPPANGQTVEVIVSHFVYQAASATGGPSINAVVSAADGTSGLSRGAAAAVYGSALSGSTQASTSTPLPSSLGLGGAKIGGVSAPLYFVSPGQINIQIPNEVPLGDSVVQVTSGTQTSQSFPVVIAPAAPAAFRSSGPHCLAQNKDASLNSISNPANPGDFVTIYLSGLGDDDNVVPTGTPTPNSPLSRSLGTAASSVGTQTVTPQFVGLTPGLIGVAQANIFIPSGVTGSKDVTVILGGSSSAACQVSVAGAATNPPPSFGTVNPTTGPLAGYPFVVLSGTGFSTGASVRFGSAAAASVAFVSSTRLVVSAPPGTGTVAVSVSNPDGQISALANAFAYQPAPSVSGIQPSQGLNTGGTSITVTGAGLAPGAQLSIGGALATNVNVSGPTSLTAVTAPYSGSGQLGITVTNDDGEQGSLPGGFTYLAPVMTSVAGVSPSSGPLPGGYIVTITGTGFEPGAKVSFGSVGGTSVIVQSSTTIQVTAPAVSAGAVTVIVTNPDGSSASLPAGFTYQAAPSLRAQVQSCQVSGKASGVAPLQAASVYLFAQTDQLYIQPCTFSPALTLDPTGSWGPVATHSGNIYAILVRTGYTLPTVLQSLPTVDGVNVLAIANAGTASSCVVAQCP